jgi:hypothetical protein
MTLDEINVLGNIFNTTYGRSGTENSPTCSITATMQNETVIIKYVTLMKMVGNFHDRKMQEIERENAMKILKKFKSDTSNTFKKQCGRKLTMKDVDVSDFIEPVSFSVHGGVTWAYFKMKCICEIK